MRLLVTRHGQTEWNAIDRICGHTDLPLGERGVAQAKRLGEKLKVEEPSIDLILVSPLLRAQQTAQYANKWVQAPIETDERLIEQNYGIYEGQNAFQPGFQYAKQNFAIRYPGGESMMQVAYRVYGLLEELKKRTDLQTVLLVSHGGTCRALNTYFEDIDNTSLYQWQMENTQLIRYTLE